MSVLRMPFLLGVVVGISLSFTLPARAEPAIAVHVLAEESWPYMSQEQKSLVELMARDLYDRSTTPDQRIRIAGRADADYDTLPDWRKAPFRGAVMRQLGHTPPDFQRGAV